MDIVFGGIKQGKLSYVKEQYGLTDEDIFVCKKNSDEVDFSKKVIANVECIIEYYLKKNTDPMNFIRENRVELLDKIIVFNDYSCGNISRDAGEQRYKEATCTLLTFLCKQADSVTRVFCGIPQIIKE